MGFIKIMFELSRFNGPYHYPLVHKLQTPPLIIIIPPVPRIMFIDAQQPHFIHIGRDIVTMGLVNGDTCFVQRKTLITIKHKSNLLAILNIIHLVWVV